MNLPFYITPFQVSVVLIVSVYSTAFHILFGSKRFVATFLVALIAFLIGHFAAERLIPGGIVLFGNVHLIEASLVSWVAMIVAQRVLK